jgi:uroporphyrinogen III methyltransferase/synthase
MSGKVYLVGVGPGKPDLITVRGLNILKDADVVIYDYLVDKRILENAKEGAELICCYKLGKRRYENKSSASQDKINALLIKKAKEGRKVVRLKNGDVGVFSRISEELDALVKNRIEFEIVPGVSSAMAASAFSGIPLTERRFSSSCIFVTGHEDQTKKENLLDWESIAKQGTIVLYMAVGNLSEIVRRLIDAGKSPQTPVAIIQDVSLITQKIVKGSLRDISKKTRKGKIKPPAIIIIGEVVRLEKDFNWLRKSKKVLFTGLSNERFFTDGIYFHLPLIKIEPLDDYRELDKWIKKICGNHQPSTINYKPIFDWIVFSSRYGVKYFFERTNKLGYDSRYLFGIKIAAIGSSTANKLRDFGIIPDLVPRNESSQGLIEEFKKVIQRSTVRSPQLKIFLLRSNLADKGLKKGLSKLGFKVTSCIAYRNQMPTNLPDLDGFDEIMFTSPSTVRNFKKRYKKIPQKVKVKYIGEVTKREVRRQFIVDSYRDNWVRK